MSNDTEMPDNLKLIHDRFRYGRESWQWWREIGKEARRFSRNRQWTKEEQAANAAAGRHSLTINIMTKVLRALSGTQRQNRRDVKVEQIKGGSAAVAEVLSGLARHTMRLRGGQGQGAISEMFDHGLRTGKGWIHWHTDRELDPFSRDLRIKSEHPMLVTEDPDSSEYDLSDAAWVDVARWVGKQWIHERYKGQFDAEDAQLQGDDFDFAGAIGGSGELPGEEEMSLDDADETDRWHEPEKYRYLVHTTYAREPQRRMSLLDSETGLMVAMFPKVRESRERAAKQLFDHLGDELRGLPPDVVGGSGGRLARVFKHLAETQPDRFELAEDIAMMVVRTVWVGRNQLETQADYMRGRSEFPVFRFSPYHDGGDVLGVMEQLIDPQRELNKRRSQALNIMNQTANSGWMVKRVMNEAKRKTLQMWGALPGVVLEKDDYGGELEKIEPNKLPEGLLRMGENAFTDAEEIVGYNSAVLGQDEDKSESGVLNAQRLRQGMTVLEPVFDNLDRTTQLFAESLVQAIRTWEVYTSDEIEALIDDEDWLSGEAMEQARAEVMREFPPPMQGSVADTVGMVPEDAQVLAAVDQERIAEYEQEIEPIIRNRAIEMVMEQMANWSTGRYGVAVTESPESATARQANMAELRDLMEAQIPVPPATLVRATGLQQSVKDEIIEYQKQVQAQQMQGRPT